MSRRRRVAGDGCCGGVVEVVGVLARGVAVPNRLGVSAWVLGGEVANRASSVMRGGGLDCEWDLGLMFGEGGFGGGGGALCVWCS